MCINGQLISMSTRHHQMLSENANTRGGFKREKLGKQQKLNPSQPHENDLRREHFKERKMMKETDKRGRILVTTIHLYEEQIKMLKKLSAKTGVQRSVYIREAIDLLLYKYKKILSK